MLAFQNGFNNQGSELMYNIVVDKYISAEPLTGRIAREIATKHDIANRSVLTVNDLNTIESGLQYYLSWCCQSSYE